MSYMGPTSYEYDQLLIPSIYEASQQPQESLINLKLPHNQNLQSLSSLLPCSVYLNFTQPLPLTIISNSSNHNFELNHDSELAMGRSAKNTCPQSKKEMFRWSHLLGNWKLIWAGLDCWEIAATHIRLQGICPIDISINLNMVL